MDPLTLGIMAGTYLAGKGLQTYGKYQALEPGEALTDRVEELKRLQEADALGLTGEERAAYTQAFMDPMRAVAAQQMQQSQALSGMAQDSGEQLRRMRAEEEKVARGQADLGRQLEMESVQRARQQEQELLGLQNEIDQREAAQKAALFQFAGDAVGTAGELYGGYQMQQELINADPGAFNAMQMQQLGAMYGYGFPAYGQRVPGYPGGGNPMMPPGYYGYYPGTMQPQGPYGSIAPQAAVPQVGTGEK
jgi:hypothetical protein